MDYADGAATLEGYLAYDTAIRGARPAILVAHTWGGQDDFARSKAEAIAQLGYIGFAIDMYGKGRRGGSPDVSAKLMQPLIDDRAMLSRRIIAAVESIRRHFIVDVNRLGAIGFCFGGLCVLDLARCAHPAVKAVVCFHALFTSPTPAPNKKITAKVLALHGYDDPLAPPDQQMAFAQEMTRLGADWQMHLYGHAAHEFTNPKANEPARGVMYDPAPEQRAWIAMKNFFEETFG